MNRAPTRTSFLVGARFIAPASRIAPATLMVFDKPVAQASHTSLDPTGELLGGYSTAPTSPVGETGTMPRVPNASGLSSASAGPAGGPVRRLPFTSSISTASNEVILRSPSLGAR